MTYLSETCWPDPKRKRDISEVRAVGLTSVRTVGQILKEREIQVKREQ